jgi:hypothetical protein
MPQPEVTVVNATFDAVNAMSFKMKQKFDAADLTGEDSPFLVRLIDDPRELLKHTADFCLDRMRKAGLFHPMMVFLSRRVIQTISLQGGMPESPIERIMISTALRVMIATSSVGAYWIASEMWITTQSRDPSVRRLQPRQREDKREGVLVVSASASAYSVHAFETIRGVDGKVVDLREMDVAPGAMRLDNPILENLFHNRHLIQAEAARMVSKR